MQHVTDMGWAVIALEIGGTKLQTGLVTPSGTLLHSQKGAAPAAGGALAILEWFQEEVPKTIEQASRLGLSVEAMGVGFGGPVESATGKALVSHQVSGWENIPLKEWFEDRFSLPTVVANDANAAGWAEYCCGAGRGTRQFFYTNIGSGIGGALIINGVLYDGQGFGAAEMGHTYIPDWTAASPGAAEKVENLCSGWSIERRLRACEDIRPGTVFWKLVNGDRNSITCAHWGEAIRQGDAVALRELDRTAQGLATAISNVITLFHPERIAVGGGVGLLGDLLLDPIRAHVDRIVFKPYRQRYQIVSCELGESVVLVGAGLLAAALRKETTHL